MVARFFLDTNQWNYLLAPVDQLTISSADLHQRLLSAVHNGQLAIISSVPVLEELMGAARSQPTKYAGMRDLIFQVVGSHWLLPLNERVVEEARHGGLLSEGQRYLSGSIVRRMREEAARGESVTSVADEVYDQVSRFRDDHEAIREKLRSEAGPGDSTTLRRTVNHWWNREVEVQDWVRDLIADAVQHGRMPAGARTDREGAPSVWCFVAFKLARIKLNLADSRAIKKSDYLDADHYSSGPYYDALVTDDKAFRETCNLLPDTPFAIETFGEFVQRFA